MMLIGILSVLSTAVYGCSGNAEETGQQEREEEPEEAEPQKEAGKEASDSKIQEEAAGDLEHAAEPSALEELSGDVYEIGTMQFVVNEITVIKGEGDTEIMVVGAPGNEADMNLITVAYDEDTRFYKRTIRNGGADYEDSDASPEDLAERMTAEMKGNYEGDVFHASEVQLVEVIM